jgi:hypothetical protein
MFDNHSLIPEAFRLQFLHTPDDPHRIVLEGEMHRVWQGHRWMRPVFWLLGLTGILIGKTGEHVPTRLELRVYRDQAGIPHQAYDRTLQFDTPVTFNSEMFYLPAQNRSAELFGPGRVLYMVWDTQFHPPDTLTLQTTGFGVRIGNRYITLPQRAARWLIGEAHFVQKAYDTTPPSSSIDLVIRHPIFGNIFGYEGRFDVLKLDKESNHG